MNNSEIIAVTETHLNNNVDDFEIHIPGWTVFRCDRDMRSGGGVLTYVKESLTVSNEFKGSDSVTEFLCLYINDLNLSVINIYRPPGTNNESFGEAIKKIDNWLNKIQKEFSDSRNIILGDFNLKDMKDWNENIISKLKATEMNRNNR